MANGCSTKVAMTPFQFFGGLVGGGDLITPLQVGDIIGLDVTAIGDVNGNYAAW